ncbi:MAG: D-alanyl-D-alanine carboxypeptidase, partial [Verrucomicrobia bacterium]|nr:D-alanyl-D-alanine carboxypeptidase [Verrucomicrobiota bacterium]
MCLCLVVCAAPSRAVAQDDDDEDQPQVVRPTGVHKHHVSHTAKTHAKKARAHEEAEEAAPAVPPIPTQPSDPSRVPNTRAVSALVIDARTGQVLTEKNADQPRAAASTQKLLTALIVAETGYLDRIVTVQPEDTFAEPVKLNIRPGETYTRIDLLRALLVKSANDVARCLARDNAGSVEAFAEKMNAKAQELGATHSHFVNPNGLPIPDQYTTARDLSVIARAAYANPTIRSIVCLPELVFRYSNGRTRELENTNKVLRR